MQLLRSIAHKLSATRDTALIDVLSTEVAHTLADLREFYIGDAPVPTDQNSSMKYWDFNFHIKRDLTRVQQLGLHRGPSRRVLDLGSGMGYFLHICRHFGHEVYGLDLYDPDQDFSRMYKHVLEVQGIPRLDHAIKPFERLPLPDSWSQFDVATAHQIQFNRLGRGDRSPCVREDERWGCREWKFLLDDLLQHAGPAGIELELRFNKPDCWNQSFSEDLKQFFCGIGSECNDPIVRIHLAPSR